MRAETTLAGETPLREALPKLESCVSAYTGIIRDAVEFLHGPDESRLVTVACTLADAEQVAGEVAAPRGSGWHWCGERARAAALGEAVERYSAIFVPDEHLVTASAADLGPEAVEPEAFALFHASQYEEPGFPFQPFRRETETRWVRGHRLDDRRPVWLPAQLVYLHRPAGDEPFLDLPTSNGLACAATFDEAVLGALLELVERDAVMLAWRCRLSLPRLTWRDHPELDALDGRHFRPAGLRYSAVDLGVFFGVPAVLGVVHGGLTRFGSLGVGAGCATTVEVAWRKALSEAFAVYRWARRVSVADPERALGRADEVRSFEDHIAFYATRKRADLAAFLDASEVSREAGEVAPLEGGSVRAHIAEVVGRLAAADVAAYAVDVTSPDIRAAGLAVARAVAPRLCTLDVLGAAPHLGGDRIRRAPFEAGLLPRPLELEELNVLPHPFP